MLGIRSRKTTRELGKEDRKEDRTIPLPTDDPRRRDGVETRMNLNIYHLILIAAFVGIVVWVFSRKRKARFEKDAAIPFDDKKS